MPVKWDFFQQANKTEVQGFKTCKTLSQQHKRAIAEATVFIIAEEILLPFCNFRESIYKLTYCQMLQSTFLEKFISDFHSEVHKLTNTGTLMAVLR